MFNYDNYIPKWDAYKILENLTGKSGWDEISVRGVDNGFIHTYVCHNDGEYAQFDTRWLNDDCRNFLISLWKNIDEFENPESVPYREQVFNLHCFNVIEKCFS